LLLFLDYDSNIVYKHGKFHLMGDIFSRLPNQVELVSVLDQTTNAHMFTLQPKWLHNVYIWLHVKRDNAKTIYHFIEIVLSA
jgi:hypothetical protein